MQEITIAGVKIQYNKDNVKIIDSYKIESEAFMGMILTSFKFRTSFRSKRTFKSWIREWKAHNRLYKLGLYRSHTVDCDLDENEKLWRLFFYSIIGRF